MLAHQLCRQDSSGRWCDAPTYHMHAGLCTLWWPLHRLCRGLSSSMHHFMLYLSCTDHPRADPLVRMSFCSVDYGVVCRSTPQARCGAACAADSAATAPPPAHRRAALRAPTLSNPFSLRCTTRPPSRPSSHVTPSLIRQQQRRRRRRGPTRWLRCSGCQGCWTRTHPLPPRSGRAFCRCRQDPAPHSLPRQMLPFWPAPQSI